MTTKSKIQELSKLKLENSSLKKKINFIAIAGLLIGGGGIFGIVKWITVERKLANIEIRQKNLDIEIKKYKTQSELFNRRLQDRKKNIAQLQIDIKKLKDTESIAELEKKMEDEEVEVEVIIRSLNELDKSFDDIITNATKTFEFKKTIE